ncbi:MAG: TIR domain-containing protein [Dolichospermum sp.]|jgi:WD40 repeat protein|uniref:TIR domain-containing protein n=1 Tax=unclassified Microcystis TaxID=2643300 RepID=UPI00258BD826|nr:MULTISPECIES: TIR domain-containing protein [unclassified Microcystis]MCA2666608.1 TIR domain-containing protein [Microcystis sp. M045S2]MCA2803744.1 TIR domain-containing protein [Microcystis sp. M114S2]MCA2834811.1 TIR domain-containing protein [Microcystis sp. M007S1]MCA2837022.1 TIR domain-containing protein [Microcystis sp. M078S1]MCA2843270.1 TIR domain-containing protein [Microcystis sp. M079S1]
MKNFFDVFISYGRADSKALAIKLNQRLAAEGLNVWFDQEDIPLAVDYQEQINDGIERTHNFIFIIAPHSVNSPYCLKEINLAIKYNKRIIPLLHVEQISQETWRQRNPDKTEADWQEYQAEGRDSSFPNMHPVISKINWIYFREEIDDFESSFAGLIGAIHQHKNYVEKHSIFLVKALNWSRNHKQTNYLLIGEERQAAEKWLKHRFTEEQPPCLPTDLHCEFISESSKNANNLMTQVFLSSSEKVNVIKEKIGKTLMREGFTIWTNQTDIKTGTAFEEEINKGIEGADNFVYLISPEALQSSYCYLELAHAFATNKRIIPLLIEKTDIELIPSQLQKLQFIELTEYEDREKYRSSIDKLLKELNRDAAYHESHKVLLVKALKWQQQTHNPSVLLRGYNLQHFEAWLKVAKQRTESPPLPLQEEFITASLNQPKASSLEVFISYSRADSDLARRLNESLISLGKLTWFDQESIASGEDFRREIYQGIEISDNFVFIISPKSINSPYCSDEVEYAQKLNKRIIPILHQKVAAKDLPAALASIQWLDFSQHGGDFLTNFTQLVRTIHTDRDHVHNHSKWLQRAKEWENSQKNADLLLRGSEFVLAQAWLKKIEQQNKQPPATELHKEFIQASQTAIEAAETAEKERQQKLLKLQQERTQEVEKRLEQEKKNARRQKQWLVVVSLLGGVATCSGLFAAKEYRKAAISEIVAVRQTSQASFALNEQLEALTAAIKAKRLETDLESIPFVNLPPERKDDLKEMLKIALYGIKQANIFSGHYGDVLGVKFSPDGEMIASASADNTLKLWKRDGSLLATLDEKRGGHKGSVNAVAFSPDGQLIASASTDNTIKLWKTDGTLLKTLKGHRDTVNAVAFSPDGQLIASAGNDTTVKLWKRDGSLLRTLKGHRDHVFTVAFSPDGQLIASAGNDTTVKLWKRDGTLFRKLEGHQDTVKAVAFSPDGQLIASGSRDKTIKIWKRDGKLLSTLEGHEASVNGLTFTPDGQQIVSGSYDKTVRLWKLDGTLLLMTLRGHSDAVNTVDVHNDGKNLQIASGSDDNEVRLWRPYSKLVTTLFGHSDVVSAVDWNADLIVSGSWDKTLKLWKSDGTFLNELAGRKDSVSTVKISPNGQFIVSGSPDGKVNIWRRDGKLLNTLKGDTGGVNDLVISPDSKFIVSGNWDKTLKIWGLDGKLLNTLRGHIDVVETVAISPDGKFIASGSADNKIKIWRLDGHGTLLSILTLTGHLSPVLAIDFSPDGRMLVSGSGDNTIKLWKTDEKGQWLPSSVKTIKGHSNSVLDVKFSPDGQQIASASSDDTIKIWQLDGTLVNMLPGFGADVNAIHFSQDGKTLVSGSSNKTIIIWDLARDLTPKDIQRYACKWLKDYLQHNPKVKASDRNFCDRILGKDY